MGIYCLCKICVKMTKFIMLNSHFGWKDKMVSSVQFSWSVVSDSLQPHGLQHTMLPCPSPTPGACSNSCPLMPSNYLILFVPFSSCLQSFPTSGSFPVSWLFASDSQSIGASASVLPMNIPCWFPLELTDLIFLLYKGLLSPLQHLSLKASISSALSSLWPNSHIHTCLLENP